MVEGDWIKIVVFIFEYGMVMVEDIILKKVVIKNVSYIIKKGNGVY